MGAPVVRIVRRVEVAIVEVLFLYWESRSLARRWRHRARRRRVCAERSVYAVRCSVLHVGSLLVHHLGATTDPWPFRL